MARSRAHRAALIRANRPSMSKTRITRDGPRIHPPRARRPAPAYIPQMVMGRPSCSASRR